MQRVIKFSIIIYLFEILLVFYPTPVFSQELPMRHYTSDEGLVQNDVNTVYEDHKGYLWFGT